MTLVDNLGGKQRKTNELTLTELWLTNQDAFRIKFKVI